MTDLKFKKNKSIVMHNSPHYKKNMASKLTVLINEQ